MNIQFTDKTVTYSTFVNDVAKAVASLMKGEKEYISQNEAFRRFGRGNVLRWRNTGRIEPCIRPGKIEYKLTELNRLQETKQDYF